MWKLLPDNNFNINIQHCVKSTIPSFYSYKTFCNVFLVKVHEIEVFVIAFQTFEEPWLGDVNFDVLLF